ncbi:hypothetical protein RCH33_2669 [Flavobacterium daejeonense]|nr:hypothetical protein RCH33_2669 [Flavobacterium daejeonense]
MGFIHFVSVVTAIQILRLNCFVFVFGLFKKKYSEYRSNFFKNSKKLA